jgi:predicted CopG family antitoxin
MRVCTLLMFVSKTTIRVDDSTADKLHEKKQRGDSYDDVIRRLFKDND